MSQVNDSNYPNQIPLAADYAIFVRDSDGVLKTATMQQYADLFASLASLNLGVTVTSVDLGLTTQQFVEVNSGVERTMTLPASSLNTGRRFIIFNKGSADAVIAPDGFDTIAGAASVALAQYESAMVTSDGLGMWSIIGP